MHFSLESYFVLVGELEVIVGGKTFLLKQGDSLVAPRDIPHQLRNAGDVENHYIVSGEFTLERKKDGKKRHFAAGEAVSETAETFHRGVTGSEPAVLIVFYAGSPGVPLTQYPCSSIGSRRKMKPSPAEPQVATRDSTHEDSEHVAR